MHLLQNQDNDITFKVNVIGTKSDAIVRVLLTDGIMTLVFPTTKTSEGWYAKINPKDMQDHAELSIEVIVNARIFTPFKTQVDISSKEEQVAVNVSMANTIPADIAPAVNAPMDNIIPSTMISTSKQTTEKVNFGAAPKSLNLPEIKQIFAMEDKKSVRKTSTKIKSIPKPEFNLPRLEAVKPKHVNTNTQQLLSEDGIPISLIKGKII